MTRVPAYVPRDDAAALTAEEHESLDVAVAELASWPAAHRLHLVPFMRDAEWDEDEVVTRARKMRTEVAAHGDIPLAAVLPFMTSAGGGAAVPPPCGALMEDVANGRCVRDKAGNPVVVIYGGFECAVEDAIRQMIFINQRMLRYVGPKEVPHVTYVYDMKPREGLHDLSRTTLDMTFMKFVSLFPSGFSMYICNAPSRVVTATKLMPSWLLNNTKVSASYDILAEAMDPPHMLPAWHPDGTLDWTLDAYCTELRSEAAAA